MYSRLSNVVVNPPWNAPTRLINEDILPKLKRDPGYAAAHNYSIWIAKVILSILTQLIGVALVINSRTVSVKLLATVH